MRAIGALLLVLTFAAPAAAQEVDSAADAEAHARFEAGRAAMAAGRPEDALADFSRAYELSSRPELLYNIGVAADRVRRDDEALASFERYLAEMPPEQVQNRAEVEGRIAVLREAIAARTSTTSTSTAPPPASSPGSVSVPAIALLVTGGVVAVGGAVTLGVGVSERARVEGAPGDASWADYAGSAERAPLLEGVGGAALGVGVALAATGVVLLLVDHPDQPSVAVLPFGAGAQLVAQW